MFLLIAIFLAAFWSIQYVIMIWKDNQTEPNSAAISRITGSVCINASLGLSDDKDEELRKEGKSYVKKFMFFLLLARFVLNLRSISSNCNTCLAISLKTSGNNETFDNFGNKAIGFDPSKLPHGANTLVLLETLLEIEIGLTVAFFAAWFFTLVSVLRGKHAMLHQLALWTQNFAGFSLLRLLKLIDPTQFKRTIQTMERKMAGDLPCFLLWVLRFLIMISGGLAILLTLGVLYVKICVLVAHDFDYLPFLMFANQMVGLTNVQGVEQARILLFLFGGSDSEWNIEESNASTDYQRLLMLKIWQLPATSDVKLTLFDKIVAIFTFGPDDLQKLAWIDQKRDSSYKLLLDTQASTSFCWIHSS